MKVLVLISICVLLIVIFSILFVVYKLNIDAIDISKTRFISFFVLYTSSYYALCLLIFNFISIVKYVDNPICVRDLKDVYNVYAESIDFEDYNDNDKITFSIRDDLSYTERLRICFHTEKSDLKCTVVKKN